MQYAKRIDNLFPEGAYTAFARAQALEAEGRQIIHLEMGQPDFGTFPHIIQSGIQAIQDGYTRYNPPAGLAQLRRIIAEKAGAQRDIRVDPSQVVIGPGSKPGLFFPTLAIVEPGDEVIYPDPGFPTYRAMIEVAGGMPVPVPLLEENNFSFDLKAFDSLITERTRLIILNSPGNPTGGIMPLSDLEHIARAALENKIWVISDEIYSRLVYDDQHAPSIASLSGMADQVVIVDGFSKTYAMTGWRLGYAVLPESLAEKVELLLTHSVGCTATFTQMAGIEALQGSQDEVAANVIDYQRRRNQIVARINTIPGIRCQKPQGAFYVFPNVSQFAMPVSDLASQLLEQAGVAVLPGTDFGEFGEGYLRLSFAVSPEEIDEGLKRIAKYLGNLH